ncbi:MAG TPA: YjgN family protein [Hyphomicrobiaceae bacterium]
MPTARDTLAAAPQRFGAEPLALTWKQQSGLIGLSIVNFILRLLTLGIYHFWGKTEVRRRIWSAIRLNGEPLEYTGTGMELFLGFLVVLFCFFVPLLVVGFALVYAYGQQSGVVQAYYVLAYVTFFFLIGAAIHRALRYRLARTRWRGIRGGLEGSSVRFAWTYFWTALLVPFTLGWIMPWRATKLQGLLSNDMRFGNRPFRFLARSGPLYGRFAVAWVGTILLFVAASAGVAASMYLVGFDPQPAAVPGRPPSINPKAVAAIVPVMLVFYLLFGLIVAWYQAGAFNHFAAQTSYEGATFKGNLTTWSMIWLVISNLLIVSLTFGLLAPVAQARAVRYVVERLSIEGVVPVTEIAQRAEDPMRRGEGLSQVFDVDAF